MTFILYKLFPIAVSTLAIVTSILTLNLNPVRAELTPDAIGNIPNLTKKIATNHRAAREKSMAYVQTGYQAQEAGNNELAFTNYYTAIEIDPSNGYAFLLAGLLIGKTETGIECVKMAAQLFKSQADRQGYTLASQLLQAVN